MTHTNTIRLLILGAILGALTCLVVTLPGCAHAPAITDGLEGVALSCAKDVESAILPAVESIAAQPTKEAALAQAEIVAGKVGWCVLSKGLSTVLDELTTKHAASNEATMRKATNLQEILNLHPAPAS